MKEQQNADLPNSNSLGETSDNQKAKVSDEMHRFSRINENNLNKEEYEMTNNKNQERKSENSESNIVKLLARNVCQITEDGEVLWNEAILLKLFEKSGLRKIDDFGGDIAFAERRGEKWEIIRTDHVWIYFLGVLRYAADLGDIADYLYHNCMFFPPKVLKAIKEESYEDVIGFEDDDFDFTDDDCSLSENPPPPRWEAPPVIPREALDIE